MFVKQRSSRCGTTDPMHLGSTGTQVRSPAWHSGLRMQCLPILCLSLQLELESDPWLRNSIGAGRPKKKNKKSLLNRPHTRLHGRTSCLQLRPRLLIPFPFLSPASAPGGSQPQRLLTPQAGQGGSPFVPLLCPHSLIWS